MGGARILLADDDRSFCPVLQEALETEGFIVSVVASGSEVSLKLGSSDLLIIATDLPGRSGIEICRAMRAAPLTLRLPIMLLAPSDGAEVRLSGLAAGADECLVKPFPPMEVVIRAKNLLRRLNPSILSHMLRVGDLTLDCETHRVHRQKREVKLGPKEFRLLEFLMRTPGKVYSRSELKASLWGGDANVDERAIDVHIGRLRKGISLGKADKVIRTVRGAGYALGDF
ncbi:response regulator transcription factor [Rhizobiaceae bacterium n13]|uniref:Response regulator transcription factor n=1 Tax=Ferirhizobium litorale TaxID=2927786 RepID=A0AAE3QHF4_9HYPH|nr:winged helix-turn-helix domain-containing protein [Fererhizobium litorale]MDI7863643.1 response regulator transcription factor [Fererhizobium litorale]MDI7923436.1 response regulator transcription factor [Fererhizobium litorale]